MLVMKHIYIIKTISFLVGAFAFVANSLDRLYAVVFNKPLFVHFYPIKKRVSKQQKRILENGIGFYKKLNQKEKRYFEHRLAMFIRNYDFIGRESLAITPEVKVLIAASYIKLTFGMRKYITAVFDKIVVYPTSFYSVLGKQYHKGEYNPAFKMILFSWEDFVLGDVVTNDNLNLGIHEFVHALTFHGKKSKDISASVFSRGFSDLSNFIRDEKKITAIRNSNYFRDYAFTNTMEFVAVITEYFFESPEELQQQFPVLYHKIEKMLNYKLILNQQL